MREKEKNTKTESAFPDSLTVSVNEEFVDSGAFESTALKDGDNVEFLYFMGGGR